MTKIVLFIVAAMVSTFGSASMKSESKNKNTVTKNISSQVIKAATSTNLHNKATSIASAKEQSGNKPLVLVAASPVATVSATKEQAPLATTPQKSNNLSGLSDKQIEALIALTIGGDLDGWWGNVS